MSILDKIGGFLGGGLGGKIADIVGSKIENKAQAELLTLEIQKAVGERAHDIERALIDQETAIATAQAEINKAEAGTDMFRGGWRPMVGWVCASGLAYQMVFRPLLEWASPSFGWMPPPSLELDTLLTLLFGMLGLGAYRSYEKVTGLK